jgi:nucleotide-binding universal stress UspA family protein
VADGVDIDPAADSHGAVTTGTGLTLGGRSSGVYDDVLIPTDGSEGTEGAIDHAIDLATTYDATVHVLYVVDTGIGGGEAVDALEALEAAGKEAIDDVIERAEAADLGTVEGTVARGAPHRAILDYVDEHGVDLVVMGTHGRTGLDRYLVGSVTEKVVRLSDVPVLTVRMAGGTDGEGDRST